jgi:hypothetical protein
VNVQPVRQGARMMAHAQSKSIRNKIVDGEIVAYVDIIYEWSASR